MVTSKQLNKFGRFNRFQNSHAFQTVAAAMLVVTPSTRTLKTKLTAINYLKSIKTTKHRNLIKILFLRPAPVHNRKFGPDEHEAVLFVVPASSIVLIILINLRKLAI